MANVTFADDALKDWRFAALARSYQMPRAWGRGVVLGVWSLCTEKCTYILPAAAVDAIGQDDGGVDGLAAAMVNAQLAESMENGLLRIRGTEGRVEWLEGKRQAGHRGGVASAAKKAAAKKTKEIADSFKLSLSTPQAELEHTSSSPQAKFNGFQPPDPSPDPEEQEQERVAARRPERPAPVSPLKAQRPAPEGKKQHPDTRAMIQVFQNVFMASRYGAKPTWGAKQLGQLDKLVRMAGAAEVERRMRVMFDQAGRWPVEAGGDMDTLVRHFDRFAGTGPPPASPPPIRSVDDEPQPEFYTGPKPLMRRCAGCGRPCPVPSSLCGACLAATA